jgi:small subunit ribosomal protein S3
MGHKIRPDTYRLGINKGWNLRFFPKKNLKEVLEENVLIRKIVKDKIGAAGIDKIEIEKNNNTYRLFIKVARPGLVIGRGGKGIEELTALIEQGLARLLRKRDSKEKMRININVEELKRTEVSAAVIAQSIATDLEKRMPYRRVIKKYLEDIMQNREVKGAKIKLSGVLDGPSSISRREWLKKGELPLQTLRSNIDYAEATAYTVGGTIGIKIWIYKGEI